MKVSFNCNINKTSSNNIKTVKADNIKNLSFKADSFEKTNKTASNKNNFSLANCLTSAKIAAETGFLYDIKTGKINGINEIQEYAQEVHIKSELFREEVNNIYKNSGENNGEITAEITHKDDSDIMKEFNKEGEIVRESTFKDNVLTDLEIMTKNGRDIYGYSDDGKPVNFMKFYEKADDGSEKTDKLLGFYEGKLIKYAEGYEKKADGSEKCKKSCNFEDDKLADFIIGIQVQADGSKKYEKVLLFNDGKLIAYIKGLEEKPDGSTKIAKVIKL